MTPARKKLYDANKSSEVLVYLSSDSRTQIDKPVASATTAGGTIPRKPQDHVPA
jgi:predicted lactoylglutathione lyase